MFRVVFGLTNIVLQVLWVMIMVSSGEPYSTELFWSFLIVIAFSVLAYSGFKMMKLREGVIDVALETWRQKGSIDYEEIHTKMKVNEFKARKFVKWGYQKNMFFAITKEGSMITPKVQ